MEAVERLRAALDDNRLAMEFWLIGAAIVEIADAIETPTKLTKED